MGFANSTRKPHQWPLERDGITPNSRWMWDRLTVAMPMWEGGGDTSYDYSGWENHGTLVGTNVPTWEHSAHGTIIAPSSSSNSEINIPDADSLNWNPDGITVIFMMKITTNQTQDMVSKLTGNDFRYGYNSAVSAMHLRWNGGNSGFDGIDPRDNLWHWMAVTVDPGGNGTRYIDGEILGTAASTAANADNAENLDLFPFATGMVDNGFPFFLYYQRVMTPGEIARHYRDPFAWMRRAPRKSFFVAAAPGTLVQDLIMGPGIVPYAR